MKKKIQENKMKADTTAVKQNIEAVSKSEKIAAPPKTSKKNNDTS